ncbi:MAG: nickel-type superoxide dismutase maturation protease [Pyrinomonadaceae bacterium]
MKNELPEADFLDKAAYFLGWRDIFIIEGSSMLPTLKPGDCILINPGLKPNIGNIVFFRHPYIQKVYVVKRLAEITLEGSYIVLGDNPPESTDSRSFGAILAVNILGVAVCRVK